MPRKWQAIEAALVDTCLAYSIPVDRVSDSGDAIADLQDWFELNLTEIAKDLEKRL